MEWGGGGGSCSPTIGYYSNNMFTSVSFAGQLSNGKFSSEALNSIKVP